MSDFTTTEPSANDLDYGEYDPGSEAAEKAGNRDFSAPVAWYPLVISKFEKTVSKAGNPMFIIDFTDSTGTTKSRYPFRMYQPITDKNKFFVGKLLGNLGFPKGETGGYKLVPSAIIGQTVEVYLEPDVYEGTTRSKPTKVRPVDTSGKGVF